MNIQPGDLYVDPDDRNNFVLVIGFAPNSEEHENYWALSTVWGLIACHSDGDWDTDDMCSEDVVRVPT